MVVLERIKAKMLIVVAGQVRDLAWNEEVRQLLDGYGAPMSKLCELPKYGKRIFAYLVS